MLEDAGRRLGLDEGVARRDSGVGRVAVSDLSAFVHRRLEREQETRDRIETTTKRDALRTKEIVVLRRRRRKKAKTLSVRLKQPGSKPPNQRRQRSGNHRPKQAVRRHLRRRRGSGDRQGVTTASGAFTSDPCSATSENTGSPAQHCAAFLARRSAKPPTRPQVSTVTASTVVAWRSLSPEFVRSPPVTG
ncbi:hypothetical protein HPB52_001843 [Rhipicephalus sanguineus]|uniref:Uncharacterized protein n=1 Tax=Rhipicephalus sanguineus TaxID=34632 RepID=A0A9D4PL51_RHISA|nr:hypothetical protein HPB52_001843 [Rhipicephalus sanguineus]